MRPDRFLSPLVFVLAVASLALPTWAPAQEEASGPVESVPERARELLQEERTAEAIELLEELHQAGRADPPARALLGVLYLESGQPAEALTVLEPLAEETSDPAVLYHAGRAALALDRIDLAERFLARSVERQPGTPAARELGLLRYRQKRYPEALRLLDPWLRAGGGDPETLLAAAWSALRIGELDRAETLMGRLTGDRPPVALLRGALQLHREDPRGALETLRPLLEVDRPELRREARILAADAYLALNQSGAAIELLEGAPERAPRLRLKLAQALYQQGKPEEAAAALEPPARQVLEQGGDPATYPPVAGALVLEYGRSLLAGGRPEEAIAALELATRILPEEHQGWKALGEALAATGRRDEARKALDRFEELAARAEEAKHRARRGDPAPGTDNRRLEQAVALLKLGRNEEALDILTEEMTARPEAVAPRLLAARALLLLDRGDEALRIAGEAVELAPDNPDARYQRGVAAMAADRLGDAERDFRRALELDPEHVPTLNDLAVLLISRGDRKEGRELLERVLEIAPEDPSARANLERLRDGASR